MQLRSVMVRTIAAWTMSMVAAALAAPPLEIAIKGSDKGRVFEGIGAVSAGASTRRCSIMPSRIAAMCWTFSSSPTSAPDSST